MKHKLFLLLALIGMMLPQVAPAYDFEVDGIYYNNSGKKNASVTYATNNYNSYIGIVMIPATVTYAGTTYNVTSIGDWAFSYCTGLSFITIPSSVTSIGKSAFSGCTALTSVTIPSGVTSIGNYAFSGCSGLTSIIVEGGNTKYDSRENCNAIIKTASNMLVAGCNNSIIPNSVTSIGERAFSGYSGLTSITIPSDVTSIGNYAFSGCSGLTSVTIPNSVRSIGDGAFCYCSGLTSITVEEGSANYDSRESCNAIIETASSTLVAGCKNTIIPNSVESIGDLAFYGCSGLTSITIGNGVKSIGNYAFYDCSGLTSITIGNGVKSIGGSAFSSCSGLTSITIGNGVKSIGEYAFKGCSGLTSITIPNSVKSIGNYAFCDCSGLTSVTIPNSVTSIGNWAFYGCSGLTSITIGNGVTSIGTSAFRDCRLTSVTNKALVPPTIDGSTFTSYCKLHVIKGYKEVYASKSLWNLFTIVDDVPFTKLTSITLDKDVYTCAVGGAETASVGSYLPEDATINSVTWSAAAPGIIFLDATTGQFVGLADGETTITATAVDGSGVTASAIVKVGSAAEGIVSEILDETSSTRLINLNGQYTTDAQHGVILQKKGHGIAKKVLRK